MYSVRSKCAYNWNIFGDKWSDCVNISHLPHCICMHLFQLLSKRSKKLQGGHSLKEGLVGTEREGILDMKNKIGIRKNKLWALNFVVAFNRHPFRVPFPQVRALKVPMTCFFANCKFINTTSLYKAMYILCIVCQILFVIDYLLISSCSLFIIQYFVNQLLED